MYCMFVLLLFCIIIVAFLRADAPWPRVLTSPPPPPQSWGAAFFPRPQRSRAYLLGRRRQCRAETLARRESLTAADDRRLPWLVTAPRLADAWNRLPTLAGWRNVSPKTLFQYFPLCDIRPQAWESHGRGSEAVLPVDRRRNASFVDLAADRRRVAFFICRNTMCPSKVVRLSNHVASRARVSKASRKKKTFDLSITYNK